MLTKIPELIPTQSLGYNHLLVFKSYDELQKFDFTRFKDHSWTYCSIEIVQRPEGQFARCGARGAPPQIKLMPCDGLTFNQIIEKFLDSLEQQEKDSI